MFTPVRRGSGDPAGNLDHFDGFQYTGQCSAAEFLTQIKIASDCWP
ncbi:hypothetical protein [Bradyrhizobium sp. dw_78]|nr:hypothetical protein [Bradyrhizobium sp. dw_78]